MEKAEQLMALQEEGKSEDLMMREFVSSRAMLLNATLRKLSKHCISICSKYEQKHMEPPS